MGGQKSKEQEVIIAQNGAGNSASTEQLLWHASSTTYVLVTICVVLIVSSICLLYRYYRKSHAKWIQRALESHELRRTVSLMRRQQRDLPAPAALPTTMV